MRTRLKCQILETVCLLYRNFSYSSDAKVVLNTTKLKAAQFIFEFIK